MTQANRLQSVLALNIFMLGGLFAVGLVSHSLGVLAAGGDYLLDSGAIALGLFAIHLQNRSGGKSRATSIVALINVTLLLIVSAFVIAGAIHRLLGHTPHIRATPVVLISALAALVMGASAFILNSDLGEHDLHMRSILLDTVSDALSAAAIAVTSTVILVTGRFFWIDSVVAILISLAIIYQALLLLRDIRRI